jgi:heat-inducible transcriptional repressor
VNQNYGEANISSLPSRVKEFMDREENKEIKRLAHLTLDVVDEIVKQGIESDIYLSGVDYFLEEPEFTSPLVSRSIFKLLADKHKIMDLMRKDLLTRDISVHIGKENDCEDFRNCSVVTAGYELDGKTIGRMGVIGPTRMDYTSVLRTLMYLSELMSAKLGELDG